MKRMKFLPLVGFILIILVAIRFLVVRDNDAGGANENRGRFKEVIVERGTFEIIVSANGVVKPIDRVEIKSKASGQIEELPIEEGQYIRAGDLIARLDQKDERAEVEQAQANLDIARAELKQAQLTFNRREQLFEEGLISEEELGAIELSLAVAKGKLIQAETTLERAEERLSEAVVRAPIDATILQKYVEQGQIIASGINNVSGGTPIVDIADMTSVHIEAGVDEIDIGKIKAGQTAAVVAEAYPQLTFGGKIVRVAPEAKVEQNVTLFDVIIEVENRGGKLKSGMNATVEITIVKKEDVLLASAIALQMSKDDTMKPNVRQTFLKQGNEYLPHRVEIGLSNFKQIEVISGLKEGDILGVPLTSRLKAEANRLEDRIRSSRSFGTDNRSSSSSRGN